eukprot:236189-Amphidinium_carterae.1
MGQQALGLQQSGHPINLYWVSCRVRPISTSCSAKHSTMSQPHSTSRNALRLKTPQKSPNPLHPFACKDSWNIFA